MKPQLFKADTLGAMVNFENDHDIYYVGEKVGDGVAYCSKKAFRERIGICYICRYDWFDDVEWDENVSDEMYDWMARHPEYNGITFDNGYTFDDLYDVVFQWAAEDSQALEDVDEGSLHEFCEYFTGVLFANLVCGKPEDKIQDYDPWEEYQRWLQLTDDDPRLTTEQRKELGYE